MPTTVGSFGGTSSLDTTAAGALTIAGVNATSLVLGSAVAANSAGTVQANAAAITGIVNVITVSANNAGVLLPSTAAACQRVAVINTHASSNLKVYPDGTGTISGAAGSAAVDLAATKAATYVCVTAGPNAVWYSLS